MRRGESRPHKGTRLVPDDMMGTQVAVRAPFWEAWYEGARDPSLVRSPESGVTNETWVEGSYDMEYQEKAYRNAWRPLGPDRKGRT